MKTTLVWTAFASSLLLAPAYAAGEGTAVGVNPDAVSRLGGAERVLVVGDDVSIGEQIVTGPSGNVQLLFDDETRLVVGPQSTLEIETYLLTGSGADKFAINALAGTFRFMTGKSDKSVYSINTPTASIAVRGTKFDLSVVDGQSVTMLYEGALTMCQGANCVDVEDRCAIGAIGGAAPGTFGWSDGQRGDFLRNFQLSNVQAAFGADFRVPGGQACLGPSPDGPPLSLIHTSPDPEPSGSEGSEIQFSLTNDPGCNIITASLCD